MTVWDHLLPFRAAQTEWLWHQWLKLLRVLFND